MANVMVEEDFGSTAAIPTEVSLLRKPKLPTRKSVEFAIGQSSPKRYRSTAWSAKQALGALSASVTQQERMDAIQKAREAFDHSNQALHDDEIGSGADSILLKHLTFLAFHAQQLGCDQEMLELFLKEISYTCDAIECIYRANSSVVGTSFARVGRDMLQLLVGIIDNELARRRLVSEKAGIDGELSNTSTPQLGPEGSVRERHDDKVVGSIQGDLLLQKATKTIGHFARVGDATKPMAYFPGLIGVLMSLISMETPFAVPWEARLSSLWTLANLACNAENMVMLAVTPGMLNVLIRAMQRFPLQENSLVSAMEALRSRSIATRAMLNLSWAPENKIILAEHTEVVSTLLELIMYRSAPYDQSQTVQTVLQATRQHAVGALRNLAAAPRRIKLMLCDFQGGQLLNVLTDMALEEVDASLETRAYAALQNLCIQDTAERFAKRPALVRALKRVLSQPEDLSDHSEQSPKAHASATLMVLERSITSEMDSYANLQELLGSVDHNAIASSSSTVQLAAHGVIHSTAI